MNALFWLAAAVAVLSTALAISRPSPVRGLVYFVVSLLAVAVIFFLLGAPFVAAFEVILYAGGIMVLFLFAVMLLGTGPDAVATERQALRPRTWLGPAALGLVLLAELVVALVRRGAAAAPGGMVGPERVGLALVGPYLLAVEIASMLLVAALVGAVHLGRREEGEPR
ncbi:MAG: NADH-quinone oxidoreductase subunit J [Deltaproteobacteria bacterium]|nr:NADH-quinone oxidoreductase subunit J [Deltaproteobacteria bacterium]